MKRLISNFLDWVMQNKYSANTVLIIMLLSGGYVIARSADYFMNVAHLNTFIGWSAASFMELSVIGGAAIMKITITHKLVDDYKDQVNKHWYLGFMFGIFAIIFGLVGTCSVAMADSWHNNLDTLGVVAAISGQLVNLFFSLFFVYHASIQDTEKEKEAHQKYLDECIAIKRKQEEEARKKAARAEGMRRYRSRRQ